MEVPGADGMEVPGADGMEVPGAVFELGMAQMGMTRHVPWRSDKSWSVYVGTVTVVPPWRPRSCSTPCHIPQAGE
jgi:hypothetical protein